MKAQSPAEGILKTHEFGNSKWYQVVCGCGQPDHTLTFEVEAEDTGVSVNTYVTVKTDHWKESIEKRYDIDNPYLQELDWALKDIWNGLVTRIKLTWNIWIKGYVQCETTIMMSEQQALNYSETLKSAMQDVKYFTEEQRWKQSHQKNQVAKKLADQGDCI